MACGPLLEEALGRGQGGRAKAITISGKWGIPGLMLSGENFFKEDQGRWRRKEPYA